MQTSFDSVLTDLEQLVLKNLHWTIRNNIPATNQPLSGSTVQNQS